MLGLGLQGQASPGPALPGRRKRGLRSRPQGGSAGRAARGRPRGPPGPSVVVTLGPRPPLPPPPPRAAPRARSSISGGTWAPRVRGPLPSEERLRGRGPGAPGGWPEAASPRCSGLALFSRGGRRGNPRLRLPSAGGGGPICPGPRDPAPSPAARPLPGRPRRRRLRPAGPEGFRAAGGSARERPGPCGPSRGGKAAASGALRRGGEAREGRAQGRVGPGAPHASPAGPLATAPLPFSNAVKSREEGQWPATRPAYVWG